MPVETSVKDAGLWEKSVHVTVPATEVNAEFNSVLAGLTTQVNLPGFRPGKVPRDVIERRFSADVKKQVAANLLQEALYTAIEKENLKAIGEPQLEEPEKISPARGQPFTFEFKTEVFPEFELPNYKELKVEQEEVDVLPEEMDNALDAIRERHATEVDAPADHAIANKDSASGVLRVLVDGAEVHKEEEARLLVVDGHCFGAHAHLGDTYLLGAKVGEKRTADETLQDGFPVEAHRGKKATIEFEVKAIKMLQLPPVDDELAKRVNMDNIQSLKDRIRSSLLEKIDDTIHTRTRENLLEQITRDLKFELPKRALENSVRNNVTQGAQYMQQMGVTPEAIGMTPEMIFQRSVAASIHELRRFFLLSAIAEKENLNAEDEEVDDIVAGMARKQNVNVEQLFEKMVEEGQIDQIETNIRLKKAVEFVTDCAEITVVPRKPFKAEHDHGHGHDHGDAGHSHGEPGAEVAHEHGHAHDHGVEAHEHGHDCGHDHGAEAHEHGAHEHGHDCGHDHGVEGHDHGAA